MNAKISFALSACLLASVAVAKPSTDEEIARLRAQLNELSNQLNELKSAQSEQIKHNESIRAELTELNDRTDEVEFASGLDKVKIGFDFTTAVSNTNFDLAQNSANAEKYHNNNKWYNEFHLNMFADVNERTKFYGRLAVAKGWNALWPSSGKELSLDADAGRSIKSGPTVYLSQAYVDFSITPELIATIGRQPGSDGPGTNLRNNAVRQATYPAIMLNTLGDAAVFTYKPSALKDYDFNIRLAYAKVYQWDETGRLRDWMGDQTNLDSNLYYFGAEGSLPLGSFGQNLWIASIGYMPEFMAPIPSDLGSSQSITDPNSGALVSGSARLPAGDYTVGDLFLATLHFENYKTFGSAFNWFLSLGYSHGSNAYDNSAAITQSGDISAGGNVIQQGPNAVSGAIAQAVAKNVGINEEDGYSAHLGIRYDFTEAFKLGLEGFYGSQYWYTLVRPSINDPLNIRTTRGFAYDLYAIYQIDANQFLRFSYTGIENRYSNKGLYIGGAAREDSRADNFMLMYHVRY